MRFINRTRSNNPKLTSIVEELKDGFCTINLSGDFIYANVSAVELLCLAGKETEVNFFKDVIRESNHVNSIKMKLNLHDYVKDYELDIFDSNGEKIPVLLTMNLIKDPGKKVIGMSLLIKDMTYIRRVQQQLLQAQKMESIGMLASGVAHEFNNILTGIIPNAELIKMTTTKKDANYQRAESIQKSANRAAGIVKKLLNFARDDNFSQMETTNFTKCALETIDILRKLFDKNIELIVSFEKDLFPVKLDETSIQQILMNLAINAKDAIIQSGKIIFRANNCRIEKENNSKNSSLLPGDYIQFTISDTGQGIEKNKIRYIFDPFYTTKKPGEGTGLGLSMVYGIVKNAQGSIEVQSKINVGTTFTLFLPATKELSFTLKNQISTGKIGKGQMILVIDDEKMIVEMAKDMLLSLGFNVIGETNAIHAINTYSKNKEKIELIILDLLMPEMNGTTCLQELKKINPKVKVIIASGVGDLNKIEELQTMGITAYLEKPYSIQNVSEKLKKVLSKH